MFVHLSIDAAQHRRDMSALDFKFTLNKKKRIKTLMKRVVKIYKLKLNRKIVKTVCTLIKQIETMPRAGFQEQLPAQLNQTLTAQRGNANP